MSTFGDTIYEFGVWLLEAFGRWLKYSWPGSETLWNWFMNDPRAHTRQLALQALAGVTIFGVSGTVMYNTGDTMVKWGNTVKGTYGEIRAVVDGINADGQMNQDQGALGILKSEEGGEGTQKQRGVAGLARYINYHFPLEEVVQCMLSLLELAGVCLAMAWMKAAVFRGVKVMQSAGRLGLK